ncbi:unnamed protein product, partial [Meganyctiphanes norvegica]
MTTFEDLSHVANDMSHVANDLLAQMKTSIEGMDLGSLDIGGYNVLTMVILPIVLVILGAILIYDLVSLYQYVQIMNSINAANGTGRRSGKPTLLSPLLLKSAGDMLGFNTDYAFGDLVEY